MIKIFRFKENLEREMNGFIDKHVQGKTDYTLHECFDQADSYLVMSYTPAIRDTYSIEEQIADIPSEVDSEGETFEQIEPMASQERELTEDGQLLEISELGIPDMSGGIYNPGSRAKNDGINFELPMVRAIPNIPSPPIQQPQKHIHRNKMQKYQNQQNLNSRQQQPQMRPKMPKKFSAWNPFSWRWK